MKRAIIDIGTNSVRLLVAERPDGGEWKTVTKKVNSTRLGEGMANNKALSLAAKERTLAAVKTFADEARSAGISDLTAYGTAIFRDSPEGPEFAKAISETIKAPMHILTGKEEAFYSYIWSGRDIRCTDCCSGYWRGIYRNLHGFWYRHRIPNQLSPGVCKVHRTV